MATGAFSSAVIQYKGSHIWLTFLDPSGGGDTWAGDYTVDWSKAPSVSATGSTLGARTIQLVGASLIAKSSTSLLVRCSLVSPVLDDDTVTVTGVADWITDGSGDTTGAMSSESVTNTDPAASANYGQTVNRYVSSTGSGDGTGPATPSSNLYAMCNEGYVGGVVNIYIEGDDTFPFDTDGGKLLHRDSSYRTINIRTDPNDLSMGSGYATLTSPFSVNNNNVSSPVNTTVTFDNVNLTNARAIWLRNCCAHFSVGSNCTMVYGGASSNPLIAGDALNKVDTSLVSSVYNPAYARRNITIDRSLFDTTSGTGYAVGLEDCNLYCTGGAALAEGVGLYTTGGAIISRIQNLNIAVSGTAESGIGIGVGLDGDTNSNPHADNSSEISESQVIFGDASTPSHSFVLGTGADGGIVNKCIARNGNIQCVVKANGASIHYNTFTGDYTLASKRGLLFKEDRLGCVAEFNTIIAGSSAGTGDCVDYSDGAHDHIIRWNILVAEGANGRCFYDLDSAGISGMRFYGNLLYLRNGAQYYATIGGVNYDDIDELNAALGIAPDSPYRNIAGNPLFVDEANSNYAVSASSPAYGAGPGGTTLGAVQPVIAPNSLFVVCPC